MIRRLFDSVIACFYISYFRFTMNKELDPVANAVYATANKVHQLVNDLCKTIAYSNISNYSEVAHALQMCKDSFSKKDNVIFNSIFGCRKNGI